MLCSGFLAAQNGTDCGEGSDCSETKKPFSDEYEYTFVKTNFFKSKYSDYEGKECEVFIRLYEKSSGVLKYKYRLKCDADVKTPSRLLGETYISIWQNNEWVDWSNKKNYPFKCGYRDTEKPFKCNFSNKEVVIKGRYYFLEREFFRGNLSDITTYFFNFETYEECLLGLISRQANIRGLFYKEYIRC